MCLSSLLAASRHKDLLDVLALQRFPFWPYRQFGVQALLAEARIEEALAYAEASRGLNQPDAAIDAACERVLLDAGRETAKREGPFRHRRHVESNQSIRLEAGRYLNISSKFASKVDSGSASWQYR